MFSFDRIQKSLNNKMFWWLDWIELIWNRLNEFEMFNEFEMTKRKLQTVLRTILRTCKTVLKNPCIIREDKNNISKFIYTDIVVTRTTRFLEVVTPKSIYHGFSTQKTFWEEKFTPVNTKSCGRINFRKHRDTKNG